MHLLKGRGLARALPQITLLVFLAGLAAVLLVLPWEGPGSRELQAGPPPT